MSDFGSYQDEAGRRPSSGSGEADDLMRVILRKDVLHSGKVLYFFSLLKHTFTSLQCPLT